MLILLFVQQYAAFTERIRPQPVVVQEADASGIYSLRVVTTFDCEGSAFGNPALSIQFRDQPLVTLSETLAAGDVVEVLEVPDVKIGYNDFLFQFCPKETAASPAPGAFQLDVPAPGDRDSETDVPVRSQSILRAAKIEIMQDGRVVGSELIAVERTGPFSELLRIQVPLP